MSGDMEGHGNVSMDSASIKSLTIRARCGRALSSWNTGLSASAWFSKWGKTWLSKMSSRYFWPFRVPSITCNGSLQSFEKQPHTVTPPPPYAVVPWTLLLFSAVFRSLQTRIRHSTGFNRKRLSSDQWIRFHLRRCKWRWSLDQRRSAWRCLRVNYGRFNGLRAGKQKLCSLRTTVLTLMRPPIGHKSINCTTV